MLEKLEIRISFVKLLNGYILEFRLNMTVFLSFFVWKTSEIYCFDYKKFVVRTLRNFIKDLILLLKRRTECVIWFFEDINLTKPKKIVKIVTKVKKLSFVTLKKY